MSAAELAAALRVILDPECSEQQRAEMLETVWGDGRVSLRSYRDAGVLTDNEGLVLRTEAGEFHIEILE